MWWLWLGTGAEAGCWHGPLGDMKGLPGSSLSFSILYSTIGHWEIKISWWLLGTAPPGLQDTAAARRRRKNSTNKAAQRCSLTSSSPFLPFLSTEVGECRAELPWQRTGKEGFSFTFQTQTLHVGWKKGISLCSFPAAGLSGPIASLGGSPRGTCVVICGLLGV